MKNTIERSMFYGAKPQLFEKANKIAKRKYDRRLKSFMGETKAKASN